MFIIGKVRFLILVLLLLSAGFDGYAQIIPDTTLNQPIPAEALAHADSVKASDTIPDIQPLPFAPNPKKAGLYSAILPGMGQLYNHQYWKMPVIYAGMAVTGYFLLDNINQYRTYRTAYIGRLERGNASGDDFVYTTDELKILQDAYKKNIDLTVLFTALGYTIQVLDAVASAHLRNFDISPDISMNMRPVLHHNGIGLGLVMNFK